MERRRGRSGDAAAVIHWKKISQRRIRVNRFRQFIKKEFRLPHGYRGNFYISGGADVVCALVMTSDGRVVLAKQFRPGPERVMWELPGGAVEPGESPIEAVRREVREETGYHGRTRLVGISTNDGWSERRRHHYVITNAVRVADPKTDSAEAVEVVTVSVRRLYRLMKRGELTDAETVYRGLEAYGQVRFRPIGPTKGATPRRRGG